MKKFDYNASYSNTPPVSTQNINQENKNSFPFEQLLQILPKLNLNGILNIFSNNQNNTQEQQILQNESFVPTQNFMRTQNLYEAQKNIQSHRQIVEQIHSNNKSSNTKNK